MAGHSVTGQSFDISVTLRLASLFPSSPPSSQVDIHNVHTRSTKVILMKPQFFFFILVGSLRYLGNEMHTML